MRVRNSILPLALLAAACSPAGDAAVQRNEQPSAARPTPEQVPDNVAEGQAAFGVALYRELAAQPGNVFLSPVSISTALAMAYAGARGETAAEMARTLRYPDGDLHAGMGSLLGTMDLDAEGRKLAVANALWIQQGYPIRAEYRELLGRHYGAEPRSLDFEKNREAAAATINRWAEENTAGKIKELLSPSALRLDTRLVLTNAVYFKGDWLSPFLGGDTGPEDFHGRQGVQRVPFMHKTHRFRHLKGDGFQALELPYEGEELAMILFLPDKRDGLTALEQRLTGARLKEWTERLRAAAPAEVVLAMPKVELKTRYELPPTLQAMGMRLAFTNMANISGITYAERIKIDKVIHQTFLAVDEDGTEAAATTAVTIVPVSARIGPPPIEFRADHPFFFIIRDNRSGAALFMGRIEQPQA